ncbi:MAG: SUMF1/EgtB/PvdO family nonheme iron enzyme [Planctomycetes bacterium]|nr:SUMF1/EgtB/PvdO family nonheme iron enzyme [Planctomycetota bacterium]
MVDNATLGQWIKDARARSLELVADLSDRQLKVERMYIVNPLDWEIGHVAYFQELFVLRALDKAKPFFENADAIFDSINIEHDVRWDLPIPPRERVLEYLHATRDRTLARLGRDLPPDDWYRNLLAVFHEDMHDEAFTYTRQTMGFSAPKLGVPQAQKPRAGALAGDVKIPGGVFMLGAPSVGSTHLSDEASAKSDGSPAPFVFDNEQWAHEREVEPFEIARAPVTQEQFAQFVDAGGYERRVYWDDEGWAWREEAQAVHPLYWRRVGAQHDAPAHWQRRDFDNWVELEPHQPVIHVNWYEAQAWCKWAGRRLPTELEWEAAAAGEPGKGGKLARTKRLYPWGNEPPTPERSNQDWRHMGCIDVAALPAGDSAFGVRQMIGNTWEWCQDTFGPYPGFAPGPYKEYSKPLFGITKVLRGGCWVTRSRLIRNTWRNYYGPERRDVWAGFRTCSL